MKKLLIERTMNSEVPVLAQGHFADQLPTGGFYVFPTLFGPVPRGHRVAREEVFGPVLSVHPFKDEDRRGEACPTKFDFLPMCGCAMVAGRLDWPNGLAVGKCISTVTASVVV